MSVAQEEGMHTHTYSRGSASPERVGKYSVDLLSQAKSCASYLIKANLFRATKTDMGMGTNNISETGEGQRCIPTEQSSNSYVQTTPAYDAQMMWGGRNSSCLVC